MTAQLTLKTLAKEFSIQEVEVQAVLEMMDAGLIAPFIARVRRGKTGALTENQLRRLAHRREEMTELDRRRGTILRQLEKVEGLAPSVTAAIESCPDRFELEDLFVPHRRPEPEVQLAMDRGLTALADLLIKPIPKSERPAESASAEGSEGKPMEARASDDAQTPVAEKVAVDASAPSGAPAEGQVSEEEMSQVADSGDAVAQEQEVTESGGVSTEATGTESTPEVKPEGEVAGAEATGATTDSTGDSPAETVSGEVAAAPAENPAPGANSTAAPKGGATGSSAEAAPTVDPSPAAHIETTDALLALCMPFVNPDRGIHNEVEALSGAARILSDRLGRNASLRTSLRRMLRKRGVVEAQASVPMDKMGRHKSLAKFKSPLKQLQGHRLIGLRQAQRERVLAVHLSMDPVQAVAKVRSAMGRYTNPAFEDLLQEIARRAYNARLLPVIEADVRLEIKERSDGEALRFLCNHLRQLMFTPTYGRRAVAGLDVSAKGDWVFSVVDDSGNIIKTARIEVGEKDDAALLVEVQAALEGVELTLIGTGNEKRARAGAMRLRKVLAGGEHEMVVSLVNEAGLGSYANSEIARLEMPDTQVPERMATSLARRLQDPMAEFLKVDPRHLSLGSEQGLVSKANLKRALSDTVESCVAQIGCDVNTASRSVLLHMPGLDKETVDRIIAARTTAPIATREALRADGLMSEAQWTNCIGFMKVSGSSQLLDRTFLHPELYGVATDLLNSTGGSVEETLGQPGATKGLRRETLGIDEYTWRDLMRELSRPGRDPRSFLMRPRLMQADTDPLMLTKDRVVEGIVTTVASFGAFIDLGLPKDAIVHISQISSRYIRDARELLSIGQVVRARITDPSGPRLTLSLKDVPAKERVSSGGGRGGSRRTRGRGRGRGRGEQRDPREGLRTGDARGMRLGGGKTRRGGGRGRGDRDRMDRGERVDLRKINSQSQGASSSPFASFFGKKDKPEGEKGKGSKS